MDVPKLIEPNVRNYLFGALQKCRDKKELLYSWSFNFVVLVVFFVVVSVVLYYCRKRKLTPYEQSVKMRKEQEYIVSKIRQYQSVKKPTAITSLPVME